MFDIFGRRAVGVFVKDDCCFPYLLITKSAYICTSWLSVTHFAAPDDARENHRQWQSGDAVAIAYQDVWTVTICFQKTVLYFSFTGQCMHFLKCTVPFPLNSSISFPPASSNQLWSPALCPYSRGIGLHAKTQPNIFWFTGLSMYFFLWWRTIWVSGSLHGN